MVIKKVRMLPKGIWQGIAARLDNEDFLELGQSFNEPFCALEQPEVWRWRMRNWVVNRRDFHTVQNRTQYMQMMKLLDSFNFTRFLVLKDAISYKPFLNVSAIDIQNYECPCPKGCIYHDQRQNCLPPYVPLRILQKKTTKFGLPFLHMPGDARAVLPSQTGFIDFVEAPEHQQSIGRTYRQASHVALPMDGFETGIGKTVGAIHAAEQYNVTLNAHMHKDFQWVTSFGNRSVKSKTNQLTIHFKRDVKALHIKDGIIYPEFAILPNIQNLWYNYKFTMRYLNLLAFELALKTVDDCIQFDGISLAKIMARPRVDRFTKMQSNTMQCVECNGHEFVML